MKKHFYYFFLFWLKNVSNRGVPNDLTDVRAKNMSNTGFQMTSQMFEPKTCPTGPELLFICLDCIFVYVYICIYEAWEHLKVNAR